MTGPIDEATVAIVPDFSRFAAQARAGIEAALRGVSNQIDAVFESAEREAAEAGSAVGRQFQQGGERAEAAFRELDAQATRSLSSIEAKAAVTAGGLSTKLLGSLALIKTGLLAVGIAAGVGLTALTGFGLKSAASLEQTTIGLQALTGSAETAKTFLGELQQFAATTPFEFSGVADASRRILAFGTSVGIAREQVIPTLTTIGDLVSVLGGTQENVNSVVRALGQMASKGKLSQEEILQLAEALPGFNANAAIAAATGHSVSETLALISAGGIDAKTGINALLQGMAQFPGAAGAMAAQSQTLLGVFSTFKDTISIALTGAFQPVIPAIKTALSELTPALGATIDRLAPALGQLVAAVLPLLGGGIGAATPVLVPILNALAQLAAVTPDLTPLGDAVGEILAAIVPLAPVLGQLATEIVAALIPGLHQWAPLLPPLVESLVRLTTALLPVIPPLTDLVTFFAQISVGGIMLLTGAVSQFAAILEALGSIDVGAIWGNITQAVSTGFSTALQFFADLPTKAGDFLSGLGPRMTRIVLDAFNQLNFIIGFGIGAAIKFFIDLPPRVGELVTQLWTLVTGLFTKGVDDAKNNVTSGFEQMLAFLMALPGRAWAALSSLPGLVGDLAGQVVDKAVRLGADIIGGVVQGIKNTIGNVGGALRDGFNSALAGAKKALGIGSPSKVFADEVGAQITAGIGVGITSGMGDLQGLLSPIVPGANQSTRGGAGAGLSGAGPIMVTVNFVGVVPTAAEAQRTGQQAGAGVLAALRRADVALAVRTT
jgi:tape measure domain-containing protein